MINIFYNILSFNYLYKESKLQQLLTNLQNKQTQLIPVTLKEIYEIIIDNSSSIDDSLYSSLVAKLTENEQYCDMIVNNNDEQQIV